eukprot:TRINITY_DN10227_c0_g1_i1.p1 TRINITY_DN10227_c0_g1~~TRINITY_DN10227_c0_g1_i1.p1  ORF type:complete len:178 (-),score=15.34 TRINITY_DN10227_c0_g1_i1:173-706(-)
MQRGLVGSEMCIRDRYQRRVHGERKYMKTILWFLSLADSLACEFVMLYIYFLHEDLALGRADTFDVTGTVTRFYPIELYGSFILAFFSALQGSYLMLILLCPLILYNLKILITRSYRVHALFLKDYRERPTVHRTIFFKSIVYALITVICLIKFIFAFTNASFYHIFGTTIGWLTSV